jgi:ribosome-associated translation inhibitor RaiA
MQIIYLVHGLDPRVTRDRPFDQHLAGLEQLIPISSAQVTLEHQREAAPAFCVSVRIAVAGPDIHAAARDYTLEAAIIKVAKRLEEQMEQRRARRRVRVKSREHCRTAYSYRSR